MLPNVSIIMPIYNGSQHLEETINSVLHQTYDDFELILVDDGSSDDSAQICKRLQGKDARIRYFYHENKGISYTRNEGIRFSRGNLLTFCDQDDLYEPDLLRDNIHVLECDGTNFVKFGRKMFTSNQQYETSFEGIPRIISEDTLEDYFVKGMEAPLFTYIWDCIFDTNFIKANEIHFDETMKAGEEDKNFMVECLRCFEKFSVNQSYYYIHYSRGNASTAGRFNLNRCEAIVKSLYNEKLLIAEKKWDSAATIWSKRLVSYVKLYINNLLMASEEQLSFREKNTMLNEFIEEFDMPKHMISEKGNAKDNFIIKMCETGNTRILLKLYSLKYFIK